MGDPMLEQRIAELRTELNASIAKVDTEVRICKHDVENIRTLFVSFGLRFDKLEMKLDDKLDRLTTSFGRMDKQQARGVGFFAGVGSVLTVSGGILLALGKLIFSGHIQ